MNITFLVSTMNDRVKHIKLEKDLKYIIVHQINDGKEKEYRDFIERKYPQDIIYEQMFDLGLSKSRNRAIELCNSKFGFILDDDVLINKEELKKFLEAIEYKKSKLDKIHFSCSHTLGEKKKIIKNKDTYLDVISCRKVSSIDMCLNIKHLKSNNIIFDESFGLGTCLPSGEEYILLTDILNSGGQVYFLNYYVCKHPEIVSGNDFFSDEFKIKSKSLMFKRIRTKLKYVLKALFYFKKVPTLIKNNKFMIFSKIFWAK